MNENLDLFFDTKEFAINVTYRDRNGVEKIIPCIYDGEDIGMMMQGIEVINTNPRCFIRTSDMDAKEGDTMIINMIQYKVIGVYKDGSGITRLELSKDEREED